MQHMQVENRMAYLLLAGAILQLHRRMRLALTDGLCRCVALLVPAGDFADLSLTFTAAVVDASPDQQQQASSAPPRTREVDLKPGGRDIAVRADNVVEYVHRLSDFRLNRQMDRAANAFLAGFFELIRPRWVRMFNEAELQMLISGSEEGIDVDDLVEHVNYAGGCSVQQSCVGSVERVV
jgi:hypothetical protein